MNTFESTPFDPNSTETVALTRKLTPEPSCAQDAQRRINQVYARFYMNDDNATDTPGTSLILSTEDLPERALLDQTLRHTQDQNRPHNTAAHRLEARRRYVAGFLQIDPQCIGDIDLVSLNALYDDITKPPVEKTPWMPASAKQAAVDQTNPPAGPLV